MNRAQLQGTRTEGSRPGRALRWGCRGRGLRLRTLRGFAVTSGCLSGKRIRSERNARIPGAGPPAAQAANMARDYDHLFKLLIIGDSGEGGFLGWEDWAVQGEAHRVCTGE